MRKTDIFFAIVLTALVFATIWQATEISTLRDRIAENETHIAELSDNLDRVEAEAIEADYQIIYWISLAEEWMRQVNEKLFERSYY